MVDVLRPELKWEDGLPVLETPRLRLRLARIDEAGKIARFFKKNREHIRRWEPKREAEYFTESYWQTVPQWEQQLARRGDGFRFRLLRPEDDDGEFLGTISLRDIQYGFFWSGTLGYTLDRDLQGRGLATEAAGAVVRFGFEYLGLRRIEARHMPANVKSAAVLRRLGFEREGLLRSSLLVDGKWEDHVVTARINPDWQPRSHS